jgi:hypothetical protein
MRVLKLQLSFGLAGLSFPRGWLMVVRLFIALGVMGTMTAAAAYNVAGVGTSAPFGANPYAQWSVPVLVALVVAALGLVAGRWWGRWLGLAAGLSGTSFGLWLLGSPPALCHPPGAMVSLLAPLLLVSLAGRTPFQYYDVPAGWTGGLRDGVVRWAAIANTAGLAALLFENLLFVRQIATPGLSSSVLFSLLAMATMATGTLLIARRKTIGLLIALSAAWMLLLSIGPLLLGDAGPAVLVLLTSVAPGILLTFLAVALYARPVVRFLRRGSEAASQTSATDR